MNKSIQGAGVALITPFKADQTIDFNGLGKIIDLQIKDQIDYLVVLGTTAEAATLSVTEKQQVIDFVCNKVNGKMPIVVGIGGNDTRAIVEAIGHTNLEHVDALLSVVPYYTKPSQEGIFQHYMAISQASPVPIILYNVPGRTGVNMSADTTLRLAHATKNIIATKEASGNLSEIMKILRDKPEGFSVISGDDMLVVPIIALGGEGVISVAANVVPKIVASITHKALAGDFKCAAQLQLKMQKFCDALFSEGNPAGVKAALHAAGMIENVLRLPLVPVSNPIHQILETELPCLHCE